MPFAKFCKKNSGAGENFSQSVKKTCKEPCSKMDISVFPFFTHMQALFHQGLLDIENAEILEIKAFPIF